MGRAAALLLAVALGGAPSLAAPAVAAPIGAAAKAAVAGIVGRPNGEEDAVLDMLEEVAPGGIRVFLDAVKGAADTEALADALEAVAAGNASLRAVFEETLAAFVADPRLAPLAAAAGCAGDAASPRNIVRIWCGLPDRGDPYPPPPEP